jgi:molybdopterin converting factor subunit 1
MSKKSNNQETMKVRLLFFANLKNIISKSKIDLDLPDGANVLQLRKTILGIYPQLEEFFPNVIVSINQEFASDDDLIPDGAEIAFFPPVSGGNGANDTRVEISEAPIDINSLLSEATRVTTGAAAIFTGIIRGETTRGKPFKTTGLEYESYIPMAEAKLNQIADEIRQKWNQVETIIMIQRIGYMDSGTPTVVVICTSSHRDSGIFEASKYGIDRIKQIVPVWKKEIGPNGEVWVEGDYQPRKGE